MVVRKALAPKEGRGPDKVITSIVDVLRDSFGGVSVLGESIYSLQQSDWISTGNRAINNAISGSCKCGIAVGRLTEIFGDFSSGKTLLAGHILAEVQKLGGIAVLIDTEHAFSKTMGQNIGIDLSSLIYIPAETVEDVFEAIKVIIDLIRAKAPSRYVVVALDSVAATPSLRELEEDVGKAEFAHRALLWSKGLRKVTALISKQKIALVFTNQIRDKIGVLFGPTFDTAGGRAIRFHSSVRIHLKRKKKIFEVVKKKPGDEKGKAKGKEKEKEGKKVIGMEGSLEVVKNKLFPPFRQVEFEVYFDRGIPEFSGYVPVLVEKGILKAGSSGWYEYGEYKFRKKDFGKYLEGCPELKEIE